ncbi:hypothetical protein M8J77_010143 [Diaphorina citri]|nr:hypothetical protein M8J77_010143 [Diaphorina citri]
MQSVATQTRSPYKNKENWRKRKNRSEGESSRSLNKTKKRFNRQSRRQSQEHPGRAHPPLQVRRLHGQHHRSSCDTRCGRKIRYMRTNIEKYTLANDIHTYVTRHALTGDIVIPRYRTTKARDSPESVAIRLYNKIPPSIRNLPLRDFLAAMEDFLLKNPIYKYNEFYNLEIPPL